MDLVVEGLKKFGGKASLIEVSRKVWEMHELDIRNAGDLLYEWQYEIRWAGPELRKNGIMKAADKCKRGTWELSD